MDNRNGTNSATQSIKQLQYGIYIRKKRKHQSKAKGGGNKRNTEKLRS